MRITALVDAQVQKLQKLGKDIQDLIVEFEEKDRPAVGNHLLHLAVEKGLGSEDFSEELDLLKSLIDYGEVEGAISDQGSADRPDPAAREVEDLALEMTAGGILQGSTAVTTGTKEDLARSPWLQKLSGDARARAIRLELSGLYDQVDQESGRVHSICAEIKEDVKGRTQTLHVIRQYRPGLGVMLNQLQHMFPSVTRETLASDFAWLVSQNVTDESLYRENVARLVLAALLEPDDSPQSHGQTSNVRISMMGGD